MAGQIRATNFTASIPRIGIALGGLEARDPSRYPTDNARAPPTGWTIKNIYGGDKPRLNGGFWWSGGASLRIAVNVMDYASNGSLRWRTSSFSSGVGEGLVSKLEY